MTSIIFGFSINAYVINKIDSYNILINQEHIQAFLICEFIRTTQL